MNMFPPDMIIQMAVSVTTLIGLIGGFIISIYNSNKNRILGDERRRQENTEIKNTIADLSQEVTETNQRLEDKIDSVAEKVEEHARFEVRIARLETKTEALETMIGVYHHND